MDEDVVSLRADERSSIQEQSNFIAYETASVATIGWQYYRVVTDSYTEMGDSLHQRFVRPNYKQSI